MSTFVTDVHMNHLIWRHLYDVHLIMVIWRPLNPYNCDSIINCILDKERRTKGMFMYVANVATYFFWEKPIISENKK